MSVTGNNSAWGKKMRECLTFSIKYVKEALPSQAVKRII
jgi:hypothetical protein